MSEYFPKPKSLVANVKNELDSLINAKINEVKNKIPSINNLATTTALTAVANEITNLSDSVKTDYNTKISEISNEITIDLDYDKYITTQDL